MSQRIMITPEEIDGVAGQFKRASSESQSLIGNLNTQINGLHGRWEGMTQQRFFQEFEQAKKNMNEFVTLLESINTQLTQISTRFRQADHQG
ncbi:WXG100 family type VII secretion target [Paenibacillus sp. 481]|uniref:WXG100 family type VII secretion target n=1 Tax=Paenibacillus sp. 481 TaxID=2835869 RepID=UPI001E65B2A7|nr:WXG100 family type VII secretion target [Paenibacillus sp. 481]UHA72075.1 WXG100 family type VII secretion target [Paenibacillus sp. 481]